MSFPEILGVLGFLLALLTFVLTRIERRRKLSIKLSCLDIEDIPKDIYKYEIGEDTLLANKNFRMIQIELINSGTKSIILNVNSSKIKLNNVTITHQVEWLGRVQFLNPINSGDKAVFYVFIDSIIEISKIGNRHNGTYDISVEISDTDKRLYKTKGKHSLILDVDEIELT